MKILKLILVLSCMFFLACQKPTAMNSRDLDFNQDWKFVNKDIPGAKTVDFNDSEWRVINLPHDWSVEDYPVQDSLHIGPFFKEMKDGHDSGYLRGGTGWYRKSFLVPDEMKDKRVLLYFDGVQTECDLYVNGKHAGKHVYGYSPFYYDITSFLNTGDVSNIIAMKVVNPEDNSRWFAGAGIYRQVKLSYVNSIHVDIWGISVETPEINASEAAVNIGIDIINILQKESQVDVAVTLKSPTHQKVATINQQIQLSPNQYEHIDIASNIKNPQLWDPNTPSLYQAEVTLSQDGEVIDHYAATFGIRSIAFSAEKGFFLNGKSVLLKGGCMHHDNGLLGAAAFQRAEERRIEKMKAFGFNAIRTSHNPPSEFFLNTCDKLGMLVIDESFDMWHKSKRPNDYSNHYKKWWKKDTKAMVRRDRNHPSVIMWSIGNEIQERADASGLKIAKAAYDFIKSIDDTRPITEAICSFWDNPGKVWDDTAPAFAILDVGGYNYQFMNYEKDHEKYPDRIIYGSESVPNQIFENWQLVKKCPYVIGDFVWTGMDYLGEAGVGKSLYKKDKNEELEFFMPWPWYIANMGDIDIIGNKKPQSHYRDIIWGESKLEMAVHEPIPEGMHELVFYWGWPKEFQSWNWEGHEGTPLKVMIYSAYPKVRLELNGKLIGEKTVAEADSYKVMFKVPYDPGELKVVGLIDDEIQESKIIKTTGSVTDLKLDVENKKIKSCTNEIAYINVIAVDSEGNRVPNAELPVQVEVTGAGELIAAGNGSPFVDSSLKDNEFRLDLGKGLIIVRSNGQPGKIKVAVHSDENIAEQAIIKVSK